MSVMVDAVDPAHIPVDLDGFPALRITVAADPAGEAFDDESGNAGPANIALAMAARHLAGDWSIGYVSMSTIGPLSAEMWKQGLAFIDAGRWPEPGVYLWPADPSDLIGRGVWRLPCVPIAVQRRYLGATDESDCAATFPARVAGYIDGPVSAWPSAAWTRFTRLADAQPVHRPSPPSPPPAGPGGGPMKEVRMFLANDGQGQYLVYETPAGVVKHQLGRGSELALLAQVVPNQPAPMPVILGQIPTV